MTTLSADRIDASLAKMGYNVPGHTPAWRAVSDLIPGWLPDPEHVGRHRKAPKRQRVVLVDDTQELPPIKAWPPKRSRRDLLRLVSFAAVVLTVVAVFVLSVVDHLGGA